MRGLDTDTVSMIKTLGSSLQALHIHDNDKHHDSHWIPYEMNIEFAPIVKALKEVGYKGEFTMECNGFVKAQEDLEAGLKKLAATARRIADEFDALN